MSAKSTNRSVDERWVDLPGWRGVIEVSSLGRVRRLHLDGSPWKTASGDGTLRPMKSHKGYLVVNLRALGVAKKHGVHTLVARVFVTNPHELPEVNHIDGDKTNNAATNLEWCSATDNALHAARMGMRRSKLNAAKVRVMRRAAALGLHKTDLAVIFDLHPEYVPSVISGKAWSWVEHNSGSLLCPSYQSGV